MNARVPLPAGHSLGKSFEHGLDINLGLPGSPEWQSVRRMSAWAPTYPETTEAVTSYDDLGASNEDVTGRSFATAFTVQANRSLTTGLYLPEVEVLLAASRAKGEAAVVDVRWYHKPEFGTPNPTDAGRANCRVSVSRQNTGDAQNEILAVTLTGKGEFEKIPNPFTGWGATVPVLAGLTPAGAGTGDLVVLNGAGLLGATSITVDGDPAEDMVVISASSVAFILPVGDAGDVPIIVTTAAGSSAPLTYTRGA
ncbi:IPT/TIG domain-containing protein [Leucobacter allii]|uniref:IPT/TIG domain-containing protein n=1 Tax=Leucobacter allii TaxID=2932247 RepID=A0ABY4FQK7_9MICO|nr:IPT/TIG domain-containing protein [Leucobacter allii]UOQ58555.1 IPT/TIG domain-containing protein [Leucobacter allii]